MKALSIASSLKILRTLVACTFFLSLVFTYRMNGFGAWLNWGFGVASLFLVYRLKRV